MLARQTCTQTLWTRNGRGVLRCDVVDVVARRDGLVSLRMVPAEEFHELVSSLVGTGKVRVTSGGVTSGSIDQLYKHPRFKTRMAMTAYAARYAAIIATPRYAIAVTIHSADLDGDDDECSVGQCSDSRCSGDSDGSDGSDDMYSDSDSDDYMDVDGDGVRMYIQKWDIVLYPLPPPSGRR